MANELFISYPASATLYAVIRRASDFMVWDAAHAAWATWADGSLSDYAIPLTNHGGDAYAADCPAAIASGSGGRPRAASSARLAPSHSEMAAQASTRPIASRYHAPGNSIRPPR